MSYFIQRYKYIVGALSRHYNLDFFGLNELRTDRVAKGNEVDRGDMDSINPLDLIQDRKSTRLNSSHSQQSRMPSSA